MPEGRIRPVSKVSQPATLERPAGKLKSLCVLAAWMSSAARLQIGYVYFQAAAMGRDRPIESAGDRTTQFRNHLAALLLQTDCK